MANWYDELIPWKTLNSEGAACVAQSLGCHEGVVFCEKLTHLNPRAFEDEVVGRAWWDAACAIAPDPVEWVSAQVSDAVWDSMPRAVQVQGLNAWSDLGFWARGELRAKDAWTRFLRKRLSRESDPLVKARAIQYCRSRLDGAFELRAPALG